MEWLITNWNDFIMGIITGLLTTGILAVGGKMIENITSGRSHFSGQWDQIIFNADDVTYSGQPIKQDTYDLKHIKLKYGRKMPLNISGTIRRREPENQKNRTWNFVGYLNGRVMTILYESTKTHASRGCIYLMLEYHNGLDEFRGFYLEEHDSGVIDKTPLILRKHKED